MVRRSSVELLTCELGCCGWLLYLLGTHDLLIRMICLVILTRTSVAPSLSLMCPDWVYPFAREDSSDQSRDIHSICHDFAG